MRVPSLLAVSLIALLSTPAASISPDPQYLFSNPSPSELHTNGYRIPSVYESAIQARRILSLNNIATLSTVFPSTHPTTLENRPSDVGGSPIGLMDYYSTCAPSPGDPLILAITIATSFKNTASGSNITLSLRYKPPYHHEPSDDIYEYSPANLPRFSLVGSMQRLSDEEVEKYNVQGCFLERHPEAEAWLPGSGVHQSYWGRLVVEDIYWIGGFGDRAYIGWIPVEDWRKVSEEEVETCRLVGEEGYTRGTYCGIGHKGKGEKVNLVKEVSSGFLEVGQNLLMGDW
ncbi:hypothetical protein MMC25_005208 [Agyrium rufum]|nr:hypothetical protein [Agyrium rufum]